jgi:hypothetical protein
MYWWDKAAELVRTGKAKCFGLITTNSITQIFNRRLLTQHMEQEPGLSLSFAVPDHPWVDSEEGAAVRIGMTVGIAGKQSGVLRRVISERYDRSETATIEFGAAQGIISADLNVGPDLDKAIGLRSGERLHSNGMMPRGSGFILSDEEAAKLGLGTNKSLSRVIRPYRNGKDLTQTARHAYVIDLTGMGIEDVRREYPQIFQWILERVKPEREASRDVGFRENW